MSITKGFENICREIGDHWPHEPAFPKDDVLELLAHTRALESMLKKVEWAQDPFIDEMGKCPLCLNVEIDGHAPDCQLAKLLEGVE